MKSLAASYEFQEKRKKESLIRDRVVFGIRDKTFQKCLLRELQLNLKKPTDFIRAAEVSKEQINEIDANSSMKTEVDTES
ncbi:hypothetical protein NPIL_211731 [Nephila pilipes]|uniref:Uncharacterized protein n=1 Tax=Nephila pilipes TaxID=299642 RepID=A0A8X6IT08_NEPPI|nr:hypothetical protein NPIL_211731 [Nephila pilipes]